MTDLDDLADPTSPPPAPRSRASFIGPAQAILTGGALLVALILALGLVGTATVGSVALASLIPIIGAGSAALAVSISVRGSKGLDRSVRSWVAFAAWSWSIGHLVRVIVGTSGQLDGGPLANALWILGFVAVTGFGLGVTRRLDGVRGLSAGLDGLAISGALILGVLVVVGDRALQSGGVEGALAIVLPTVTLSGFGLALVAALARRWRLSAVGAGPALLALLLLGTGWLAWPAAGALKALPVESGWAVVHAAGWLLLAYGAATFRDGDRAGPRWKSLAPRLLAALPAVAVIFVVTVVAADKVLINPDLWLIDVFAIGLTMASVTIRQVFTIQDRDRTVGRLSRTVRTAYAAREDAEASHAEARARADLANVILAVSEDLRLADAESSYQAALRRIAPPGARASLARLDDDRRWFARIAAVGPDVALNEATYLVDQIPGGIGALLAGDVVGRRIDDSHPGAGIVAATIPEATLRGGAQASLTVPISRPDGWLLGVMHFEDLDGDRILEPEFVALARSTANHLATSIENLALLDRLRSEIIERDRIQGELVQASKALAVGELAGAVAHEVNNPLTGILGYAELLLDEFPEDDSRREDLQVIRDEAVRARSIVRALVDLAQSRTGARTPSDLRGIGRDAVQAIRDRADVLGIDIAESYADTPAIEVDRSAMCSVVVALLDNALTALPDGGRISVNVAAESDDRVVLTVSDTGAGMDSTLLRRVFEPFFSTHAPRSGRGMGLTVSLGVVRDHGGSIWIDSRPGEGTAVEVRLPVAITVTSEPVGALRAPAAPTARDGLR